MLAFARLRELVGGLERSLSVPSGARVEDAWSALVRIFPALADERDTTRIARNGRLGSFDDLLTDGDEIALLPPVGGG